jgi:hypothetical protein
MAHCLIVTCDMVRECNAPVAYIDAKGYAYCAKHGLERQSYQRCRKLRPYELKRLLHGETLKRY